MKIFSVIDKISSVLEIGPGTGVNFRYYPKGLKLTVVEPNILLHKSLKDNALKNNVNLKIVGALSENLSFKNKTFDYVISTLVLCSVRDLPRSLQEIRRVLKNRGKFLFIEHVLDRNNVLRRGIQHAMAHSPWTFLGDNCHPNRDISLAIQKSGFSSVSIKRYYQLGLGFIGEVVKSHIVGFAVK